MDEAKFEAQADQHEDDPLDLGDDPSALALYNDTLSVLRLRASAKTNRGLEKLSQRAVAEIMGTTQSAVSDLESGRVDAQLTTWQRYARAIGRRLAISLERSVPKIQLPIAELTLSSVLTELERSGGPQLIQRISRDTKLPIALVSRVLYRLKDEGWTNARGEGDAVSFELVNNVANMIGISIHRDRLTGVLTDLQGSLTCKPETVPIPSETPESVAEVSAELVRALFNLSLSDGKRVLGVGACIAGIVDRESGAIRFAPDMQTPQSPWVQVGLEDMIEGRVRERVHSALRAGVDNDADSLALWHFRARGSSHHPTERTIPDGNIASATLVLMSGAGIGSAFVIDGKTVKGANSKAGEIGHLVVDRSRSAPPCRVSLNHLGCLESVSTVQGILRRLGLPADDSAQRIASMQLADRAIIDGDSFTREVFFRAGRHFGSVLPLLSVLDCSQIAIYASPFLHSSLYATAGAFQDGVVAAITYADNRGLTLFPKPEIKWFGLDEDTLAKAAAFSAFVTHFLSDPSRWYPKLESAVETDSELVLG